mgnify:CR=1 FL=1
MLGVSCFTLFGALAQAGVARRRRVALKTRTVTQGFSSQHPTRTIGRYLLPLCVYAQGPPSG